MKTINYCLCLGLGAVMLFGGAGCGAKKKAVTGPKSLQDALTDVRTAVATASSDVQSNFYHEVSYSLRYGNYKAALAGLQHIDADTSLNAQQKQAVDDAIQAVQKTIDGQQNAPSQ